MTFDEAHRRIKRGDLDTLREAISQSTDANLTNRLGWTLLMLCAMEGFLSGGKLLHAAGASIDSENDFGETALSLAAQKGHLKFVEWLVAEGASKNPRPHGHDLATWVKKSSGLPESKITAILGVLR